MQEGGDVGKQAGGDIGRQAGGDIGRQAGRDIGRWHVGNVILIFGVGNFFWCPKCLYSCCMYVRLCSCYVRVLVFMLSMAAGVHVACTPACVHVVYARL